MVKSRQFRMFGLNLPKIVFSLQNRGNQHYFQIQHI